MNSQENYWLQIELIVNDLINVKLHMSQNDFLEEVCQRMIIAYCAMGSKITYKFTIFKYVCQ